MILFVGSIPTRPTKIMQRREFLKLLGITAISAPVLAAMPEEPQVFNRITMSPKVYKMWEQDMANSLKAQVRKRHNQLVAEMYKAS